MPVKYSTKQARADAARRTKKHKELLADWEAVREAIEFEKIRDVLRIPQAVWNAARAKDVQSG